MKGLILCAGKGTRLQPLTNSYPKTLLPVANVPILKYCIDALTQVNVREIGIVIHPSQKKWIKAAIGTGNPCGVKLTYIYQQEPKGIADAVKHAKDYIGTDPFLLLLGDNLITESLSGLRAAVEDRGCSASLLLAAVGNPKDYGIAEVCDGRIVRLEEKPRQPKSNLAALGAYAFDSSVFAAVDDISPSSRGEYELTDAVQWLIDRGYPVYYNMAEKRVTDVGTIERWLEANRYMLKVKNETGIDFTGISFENTRVIPPVAIEAGCEIKDCVIGPYVSIGAGATIEGCRIENSILLPQIALRHIPYPIKDSILGRGSVMAGLRQRMVNEEK